MSMYDGWSPERIEAYRKYHREYRRKHRDEINQRVKDNRAYNREHILNREAEWRDRNRDKVHANNKRYYTKNATNSPR